ncbi:MAG: hypothetical protein AAGD35_05870 [Actinomycetota bacterium]
MVEDRRERPAGALMLSRRADERGPSITDPSLPPTPGPDRPPLRAVLGSIDNRQIASIGILVVAVLACGGALLLLGTGDGGEASTEDPLLVEPAAPGGAGDTGDLADGLRGVASESDPDGATATAGGDPNVSVPPTDGTDTTDTTDGVPATESTPAPTTVSTAAPTTAAPTTTAPPTTTTTAVEPGPNLLQSGGFELPLVPNGTVEFVRVRGWSSTGAIELWGSGLDEIPAVEGRQFLELNSDGPSTISQTVFLEAGTYRWSFLHRGRIDDDTAEFLVDGVAVSTHTAAPGAWSVAQGRFEIPNAANVTIGLRAVDPGTVGNLVDGVTVQRLR